MSIENIGYRMCMGVVLCGALVAFAPQYVAAVENTALSALLNPQTLSVTGTGSVVGSPEVAHLSFTLSEDNLDDEGYADASVSAVDVLERFNTKLTKILASLATAGIGAEDVKTQDYEELLFTNSYGSYTMTQMFTIEIDNLADVAWVVDMLVQHNVRDVYSPQFSTKDGVALKDTAREKAIADAQQKAAKIAKQLGVTIVRVYDYYENDPSYYPNDFSFSISTPAKLPVAEVRADVNITYVVE